MRHYIETIRFYPMVSTCGIITYDDLELASVVFWTSFYGKRVS
ncbi:MAG: hypothetical protein V3V14_14645 [Saprospiraceae bacterium]